MDEWLGNVIPSVERASRLILDNIGIHVAVSELPSYAFYSETKEKLDEMSPVHRLFSWKLRRRYNKLQSSIRQQFLNAVLDEASSDAQGMEG